MSCVERHYNVIFAQQSLVVVQDPDNPAPKKLRDKVEKQVSVCCVLLIVVLLVYSQFGRFKACHWMQCITVVSCLEIPISSPCSISQLQILFYKNYLNWAGFPWVQHYNVDTSTPRPMVGTFSWAADRVGDVHKLHSKEGFW